MAYTKQTWADLPSKTTPINATRLTHIEDGIFNAAATADNAASAAGTAAANVGIVSGKVETLTGRVNGLDTAVSNKVDKVAGKGLSTNDYDNTDKGKVDSLGTASTKNSTSVVTESSDLVESGAVYDALGFGNKNLLPVTLDILKAINTDGTWNGNVFTKSGVDFTVSADGNKITQIDVNASSATTGVVTMNLWGTYTANTDLILNGSPTGGSNASYGLKYTITGNTKWDYGDGVAIDNGLTADNIQIRIASGVTVSHKVFKPMLRLATVSDDTYEPYHASVEDSLAEKCDNSVIGTVEDGANPTKSYAVGEHMVRGGKFCTVTVAVTTSSTWTLGSNYIEGTIADNLVKKDTFSGTTSELGAIVIYNSNDRVILSVEVLGDTASLYKRSIGYGSVIRTPQGETLINTAVSGTYYYI